MLHVAALVFGFVLDVFLGDPHGLPHPIRAIGTLISASENLLRKTFPSTKAGQRLAGVVLVIVVVGVSCAVVGLLLWLCYSISVWLGLILETILCYYFIAARSLEDESMKVYTALTQDGVDQARRALAMIVGRDTDVLDEEGITRATVETIAENTSDGVVAPIFYMALFGAVGGVCYKAVNTMDSMVGYTNNTYRYFGTAAARLDDILNWIPARLSGALMCAVAPFAGLNGNRAWHIFKRDRKKHASPNAACTEAACAGALGVQLAGPAQYFGEIKDKPFIGDNTRPIEANDIKRANTLLFHTAVAALVLFVILGCILWAGLGRL